MSTMTMPARLAALPRDHQVRLALKLDAVVTGVNGAAYLVAAAPLGDLLGLSPALLRGVGAFLVAFAAGIWVAATRAKLSRLSSGRDPRRQRALGSRLDRVRCPRCRLADDGRGRVDCSAGIGGRGLRGSAGPREPVLLVTA